MMTSSEVSLTFSSKG